MEGGPRGADVWTARECSAINSAYADLVKLFGRKYARVLGLARSSPRFWCTLAEAATFLLATPPGERRCAHMRSKQKGRCRRPIVSGSAYCEAHFLQRLRIEYQKLVDHPPLLAEEIAAWQRRRARYLGDTRTTPVVELDKPIDDTGAAMRDLVADHVGDPAEIVLDDLRELELFTTIDTVLTAKERESFYAELAGEPATTPSEQRRRTRARTKLRERLASTD